jgi:[ribosomal protein S18]-alanine N-acetyltransferase
MATGQRVLLPVIQPMTAADVSDIMPLERLSFKDPWTRRMYVHDISDNLMATYLVAKPPPEAADRLPPVLAWGGFWLMVDEAHISTVASHPDYRGCGLGQLMMLELMEAGKERGAVRVTLEVRAFNLVAQGLYEKLGFKIVGTRRSYYRDGEAALIMTTPDLDTVTMQARMAAARDDVATRVARCTGGEHERGKG